MSDKFMTDIIDQLIQAREQDRRLILALRYRLFVTRLLLFLVLALGLLVIIL